jgi:hypothetical protein
VESDAEFKRERLLLGLSLLGSYKAGSIEDLALLLRPTLGEDQREEADKRLIGALFLSEVLLDCLAEAAGFTPAEVLQRISAASIEGRLGWPWDE